jgi:hypothetical protein
MFVPLYIFIRTRQLVLQLLRGKHPDVTLRVAGFLDSCPSSGILNTRKHRVSETGSVSVFK